MQLTSSLLVLGIAPYLPPHCPSFLRILDTVGAVSALILEPPVTFEGSSKTQKSNTVTLLIETFSASPVSIRMVSPQFSLKSQGHYANIPDSCLATPLKHQTVTILQPLSASMLLSLPGMLSFIFYILIFLRQNLSM